MMGMMDSVNTFVDTMIAEQQNFENLQSEVSKREDDVLEKLRQFEMAERESITEIKAEIEKSNDEDMMEIFSMTSDSLFGTIADANRKIEEAVKGMKFIQDFEKRFTVAVFGKVKAGKSYIGNLIMGQPLRGAGIASSYDKLENMTVHVYDRGKQYEQKRLTTADEEKECNGVEFYVDMNEATSTIQWVDIGGMCWFDTPGIGSVTYDNEELAKEYVKNADLVIFACNSDAAGTRGDFSEIKQLHDMKKPILLLLTQSDENDYDVDDDGEEIITLVPKSDKDRKDQEDYMLETLQEQGLGDVLEYSDDKILTVSALLATEALKNQDETMFEQSNIGKLLDILTRITKNEAADMKRNTPKNRINEMIDSIIVDLKHVSDGIGQYCSGIEANREQLSGRKDSMVEQIRAKLNLRVLAIVEKARAEVDRSKGEISGEKLAEQVNRAMAETIQQVCAEESISQSEKTPDIDIRLSGIGDMRMRQDKIPYERVIVKSVRRDPKGVFEKIGHAVFKKEYYTSDIDTVTAYSTFDIGVNDKEIAQQIMLGLNIEFSNSVEKYIESLTTGYYEPIAKLRKVTDDGISRTIENLKEMRM